MLIALGCVSLFVGKYPLSMDKLLAGDEMQWRVFVTLRLSRTVVGLVGGFALGVAGFVYQTVFRNPLASPDIIGVSSGASAGAAVGILFLTGAASVTVCAFAGALLAMILALGLSSCHHATAIVSRSKLGATQLREVNGFRIGPMGFITHTYEMSSEHADELKAAITNAKDGDIILIANDITVTDKWDNRYGKKISNSYTYEVTGNTLRLTDTETGNVSTYIKQ